MTISIGRVTVIIRANGPAPQTQASVPGNPVTAGEAAAKPDEVASTTEEKSEPQA